MVTAVAATIAAPLPSPGTRANYLHLVAAPLNGDARALVSELIGDRGVNSAEVTAPQIEELIIRTLDRPGGPRDNDASNIWYFVDIGVENAARLAQVYHSNTPSILSALSLTVMAGDVEDAVVVESLGSIFTIDHQAGVAVSLLATFSPSPHLVRCGLANLAAYSPELAEKRAIEITSATDEPHEITKTASHFLDWFTTHRDEIIAASQETGIPIAEGGELDLIVRASITYLNPLMRDSDQWQVARQILLKNPSLAVCIFSIASRTPNPPPSVKSDLAAVVPSGASN